MSSRIHRVVLSLGLTAAVGFAFTPLGCGSSIPPAVSVPEDADLTRQLRACAAEHEGHLGYAPRSMSFDVKLTDVGYVESIALRDESFRDESLEACMVHALRSLTIDELPMRLSGGRSRGPVAPESRVFLGQAEIPLEVGLEACLASPPCAIGLGLVIGASFIAVTVYVYVNTKPTYVRPRPPMTMATVMPTATAVPTAIPVPLATTDDDPCMPLLLECLENVWQPQWNRKTYGPRKDCNACYHDCKDHSKGVWPDKKCPRE